MSANTWNDPSQTPLDYKGLYIYKTDTVFGIIYGGIDFAMIALKAGVKVVPEMTPDLTERRKRAATHER